MGKIFAMCAMTSALLVSSISHAAGDLPLPSEFLCRDLPNGLLEMEPAELLNSGLGTVFGLGFFTGVYAVATGDELRGPAFAKGMPEFLAAVVAACRQQPDANAMQIGIDTALSQKKVR